MSTHRLVLHQHPFASFCWKPLIALYELELPFQSHLVDDDAARRELARLWSIGRTLKGARIRRRDRLGGLLHEYARAA